MPQTCFGSPQGRFWRGLGASWACLRRNLDALGELLDSLGCLCAVSWPPFGCFLGALGRIWALIGASVLDFGWSWAPPGWVLASSGAVFATIFEGDALIAAGIPAWHSHWHFVTSLQRGGTCAAHPPPPEGRAVRAGYILFYHLICLPLRPASRIRLQIPSSSAFPYPFIPSPGSARTAALRPQFAFEASKCDFLAFRKPSYFLYSFFSKNCENH